MGSSLYLHNLCQGSQWGKLRVSIKKWPFKDKMDVISITTKGIVEEGKTILYESHDEDDGMWQFHDGTILKEEDARIVSLKEVYELDPTIGKLSSMPCGWHAWRDSKDEEWNMNNSKLF